jgi:cell wall-associated NlpC family hydrolase
MVQSDQPLPGSSGFCSTCTTAAPHHNRRPDHGGTATRSARESPGPSLETTTSTSSSRRATAAAVAVLLITTTSHAAAPRTEPLHAVAFAVPRVFALTAGPDGADADLVGHKRVLAANAAHTRAAAEAPASTPQPPAAVARRQKIGRAAEAVRKRRPVQARAVQARVVRARAPRAVLVAQPAVTSASPVVAYALAQVGKPYRWAAAGPGAFDCSGLVLAAYARVGARLPHQTGSMIRYGTPVARSQLQPGDIVFPSSHHVAIYIGGGRIVHAPKPGDHVRVAPLYAFYAARRL